jgi:hypothetical protein
MKRVNASLLSAIAGGLVVSFAVQAKDIAPKATEPPEKKLDAKSEPAKLDPKADALLRKMSDDLGKLKTFSFDTEHVTDVITTDDQKLQMLASSSVTVQRPNKLRSDRKGPLGDVTLYYDGKQLTIYGKRDNLYATAPAPDTLDKLIDFARNELDLDAPAADLLYGDPYAILMENAVSSAYIDDAVIGGRVCKHLAYRGKESDFEIWIEDTSPALPCRFVITTKDVKGWPQYSVEMSNWKVNIPAQDKQFAFVAPRDAGKIDFVRAASAAKKAGKK